MSMPEAPRGIGWYNRINPELAANELPRDDSDLWQQVHASSADVMLWHGPHPVERIFAIRACWHLRDSPERVYEVALPATGTRWKGGGERPAFYDAVAIAGPNVAVQAWDHRTKVFDVAERANRWEVLRDQPGDWIRILDGEAIVQLPITAYDAAIADACSGRDWMRSSRVIGGILADHQIGYALLTSRIRELVRAGKLEGRGEQNRVGLPTDIRSTSALSR
jgi:hypothetical protein